MQDFQLYPLDPIYFTFHSVLVHFIPDHPVYYNTEKHILLNFIQFCPTSFRSEQLEIIPTHLINIFFCYISPCVYMLSFALYFFPFPLSEMVLLLPFSSPTKHYQSISACPGPYQSFLFYLEHYKRMVQQSSP